MILILLVVLLLSSFHYVMADSACQTDWSGGPGVHTVVTAFGSEFSSDTDVKWCNSDGYIELNYQQNYVTQEYDNYRVSCGTDIDGDGDIDVLVGRSIIGGAIKWYENVNGDGMTFSEHQVGSISPYGITCFCADDIDGDNDQDILYANVVYGVLSYVSWLENTYGSGTHWTCHNIDYSLGWPAALCTEDFDGDGDRDVLVADRNDHQIVWFENVDGTASDWEKHQIDGRFRYSLSVCSRDIDGDGDPDVIGAAAYDDEIAWWENYDGLGHQWVKHVVCNDFMHASSVHSEDVDSDGDSDIIGSSSYDDDIILWINQNGAGTLWTEYVIDEDFDGASTVFSGDFDGDDDIDIVAGSEYYCYEKNIYRILWWENCNGSSTDWVKHVILDEFGGVCSVHSADFNGDDVVDILGGSSQEGVISWWNVLAHSSDGLLESSILDTQGDPDWGYLEWSSQIPSGTSVSIQVRASEDHTVMGAWSDTLSVPCSLEGILTDGERYVQYRAILETTESCTTPILLDVTLNWDFVGVGDNIEPISPGIALLPVLPNPSHVTRIRFSLPEVLDVSISIFDLSGRLVHTVVESAYPAGQHDLILDELFPGIYFCRMISGEFAATQRFVVIE
ncbi:MAG: T9SS type A sorting domain-containing protein [Candidatus Fermentibacteraceae bacterium]|nr:T9SS type A sorting domain-containing protein [Candidatus Fermentibacteraceae bacterium]MBN2609343.1 T9SS type A sorting domain-containing protein [Candidatus Fermentibacteraceae bacterium]